MLIRQEGTQHWFIARASLHRSGFREKMEVPFPVFLVCMMSSVHLW